jgi:hypothetical protein
VPAAARSMQLRRRHEPHAAAALGSDFARSCAARFNPFSQLCSSIVTEMLAREAAPNKS